MFSSRFLILKIMVFGFFVGLLVMLAIGLIRRQTPLLSPISSPASFTLPESTPAPEKQRIVYGFLPYWNLPKAVLHPELTHLAYFSLTIGADGAIVTEVNGHTDLGYARWSSTGVAHLLTEQRQHGGKTELVLTQFKNEDIVAFLSDSTAQQKFITELDSVLLSAPIDGVNMDIEYSGEVTPELRQQLVGFMQKLRQHLKRKHATVTLSMDVYSSAIEGKQVWDVAKLAPTVDYFIVMAYDFHRQSSSTAGPVAPVFGGNQVWNHDILQHLRLYVQTIPPEKILLGIPFYGYEWQTTSRESQAHTYPKTGATASLDRVNQLLAQRQNLQLQQHWNELALSPYLSYQKGDQTYVLYYEDARSISYKLDLVNQLDLGGIAIWALGYEGQSRELWDVINRKF